MGNFYFRFIPDDEGNPPPGCCFGEVCIGSFRERFLSDVTFWRRADYEKQWASAASSILSGDKTGLIVSLPDPSSANFVRWWAMYREGEVVFLQEQICFLDELSEKFDPDMVYKFVRSRETTSEDGQAISEWSTTVSAVRGFLDRQPLPDC
jgi:hypothetical protein